MATLKESGEAWIASGQAEYGQMLVDAADTIERLQKELDVASPAEAERYREAYLEKTRELEAAQAEVERLKARTEKQSDMIRTIDPLYR